MQEADLLVLNIGELATLAGEKRARKSREMSELSILKDAGVAMRRGKIIGVGPTETIRKDFKCRKTLDVGGRCVTPGLVDAHTHLIFAGSRAGEFEKNVAGVPYMDIARAGGGILSTVRQTRKAKKADLIATAKTWLDRMLEYGTTTAEVKSGYGLNVADEIKQLEVVKSLAAKSKVTLIPTFLGAHETPEEFEGRRGEYVRHVIEEQIPEVAKRGLAKFCDVFCEVGVFSADEAKRVLLAGKEAGLIPKLHADVFKACGGADVAAEVGAVSADHLSSITRRGVRVLRDAGVIALLLPGMSFFLGIGRYAPAREMIDVGLAVALGSDFNPGSSMSFNMPLILSIACTQMKMSPAESLCAATINAAYATGVGDDVGSIEMGKRADLVVWDAPDYRHIPYVYGVNLVWSVVKSGKVEFSRSSSG